MTTELVEEKVRETLRAVRLDGVRAPDDLAERVVRRRGRRRFQQSAGAALAVAAMAFGAVFGLGGGGDESERPVPPAAVPDGWQPWKLDSVDTAGNGCLPDGDALYCKGYKYDAVKFDARTGEQLWTLKVKGEGGSSVGRPLAARDGVLYIYRNHTAEKEENGDYRAGTDLVAVDADTGRELWDFEMYDDARSDERAMLIDGAVLVNTPSRVWAALDPRTGAEKWSHTWEKGLWCQGTVLSGTPYQLCTVERDDKDDTDVFRLDAATGEAQKVTTLPGKQALMGTSRDSIVVGARKGAPEPDSDDPWEMSLTTITSSGKQTAHSLHLPGPMRAVEVVADQLIAVSQKGVASATSLTTGKTLWSAPTGVEWPKPGGDYVPTVGYNLVAASQDVVYFFSPTGDLSGLDARTGEQLWRVHVDTKWPQVGPGYGSMPQLFLYGDALIARDGGRAFSLLPKLGD
ncbi:PQQ-binding-like beta-propeller repeat protein [Streptomyces sp. E11-3]|uniref:outer membrane protein assembly factor BamB family protein n=1 Tax=Streptomyces sp. E11-3 TaxID=3110112 RepID=UPI00397FC7EE